MNELAIKGTPVLVSGMENSGTRVAVWYLQSLGIDMGEDLFQEMSWKPIDSWVRKNLFLYFAQEIPDKLMEERLFGNLLTHSMKTKFWGFKSPRSIYLHKFLKERIPSLKFIHIIRDGRDVSDKFVNMAIEDASAMGLLPSKSSNSFLNIYDKYLYIWGKINEAVAKYFAGSKDYILLRLEDMVNPNTKKQSMTRVMKLVESDFVPDREKSHEVFYRLTVPGSIGRHKVENRKFSLENCKSLGVFGYGIDS